jgi:hypothetical protein
MLTLLCAFGYRWVARASSGSPEKLCGSCLALRRILIVWRIDVDFDVYEARHRRRLDSDDAPEYEVAEKKVCRCPLPQRRPVPQGCKGVHVTAEKRFGCVGQCPMSMTKGSRKFLMGGFA